MKKLTFGSLFTGIGGIDLGLERAGWQCQWYVEIDPDCNQVLEKHWPDVRRYEDVKDCGKHNLEPVDLVCGGFPCQDVSQAGKRAGLKGERTGLFFEAVRIVKELKPKWFLWENVPGLLTSNKGADFAVVLQEMDELGYGLAWRVLDSRFFGVAQRRRRVFIVGSFGSRAAEKVLFEADKELLEKMDQWLVSNTLTAEGQTNPSGGQGNQLVVGTLKAAGVHTMSGVEYVARIGGASLDPDRVRTSPGLSGRVDGGLTNGHDQGRNHVKNRVEGNKARSRLEESPLGHGSSELQEELEGRSGNSGCVLARQESGRVPGQLLLAWMPPPLQGPEDQCQDLEGQNRSKQGKGQRSLLEIEIGGLVGLEALEPSRNRKDGQECPTRLDKKRWKALGNAVTVPVAEWIGRQILASIKTD